MFAKADAEKDPAIKADFENMGRASLLLTEQADRNAQNDVVYQTPPPPKDRRAGPANSGRVNGAFCHLRRITFASCTDIDDGFAINS